VGVAQFNIFILRGVIVGHEGFDSILQFQNIFAKIDFSRPDIYAMIRDLITDLIISLKM